jgi:hypothetical protein
MNIEVRSCIEHEGDVAPLSNLNENINAILFCFVAYASMYGLKPPN